MAEVGVFMKRLARLVTAAEVPVILATAPVLLFPTPEGLVVLVVVPFLWLCASINGDRIIPRTPMNLALGLLLAMVGVSLHVTFDVQFSLGKVSGTVLGVLLFWAVVRWLTTSQRLAVAVAAFLLVGTGLAIVGSAGVEVGPTALWLSQAAERWASPLRSAVMTLVDRVNEQAPGVNPNAVAGCLVLFVPLQVVLLAMSLRDWPHAIAPVRWDPRLAAFVQATMLFITAGTVWLMHSRGAWLGLATATGVFLIWHSRLVRMVAAGGLGIILVLAAALGPLGRYDGANTGSPSNLTDAILIRQDVWSTGISGVQDSPLVGMGMNTFREIRPNRYPLSYLRPGGQELVHAHNNLIQAAWDLGIPGLVAYVSLWMISGLLLIRVYRHSNGRIYRAIAGGLGAGLVAHFMFGMTDAIPLGAKVGASFWLALALVVGLHRVALDSEMSIASHVGTKRTD